LVSLSPQAFLIIGVLFAIQLACAGAFVDKDGSKIGGLMAIGGMLLLLSRKRSKKCAMNVGVPAKRGKHWLRPKVLSPRKPADMKAIEGRSF